MTDVSPLIKGLPQEVFNPPKNLETEYEGGEIGQSRDTLCMKTLVAKQLPRESSFQNDDDLQQGSNYGTRRYHIPSFPKTD